MKNLKQRAEELYEELTYHSHRPDEVAIIQRVLEEVARDAVENERSREVPPRP